VAGGATPRGVRLFRAARKPAPHHPVGSGTSDTHTLAYTHGWGRLIDNRIRLLGLPGGWRTLISTYDLPRQFVDEQIRGPYAFWHHRHRFEVGEAGTRVIDEVRYAMPLAGLGRLVHGLWVRPYLRRIFEFRGQVIARLFTPGNAQGRNRGGVLIRFAEADLIGTSP
jgi:ligand-binding SRPBCC domain-containing protein